MAAGGEDGLAARFSHRRRPGASAPAGEVEVRWWRSREELAGALAVRERVFVGEQGVPVQEELDELDEVARHVVALARGGPGAPGAPGAPGEPGGAGGPACAGGPGSAAGARALPGPGGEGIPRVVGTLRLLVDGERAKVGRVAVEREWRRRGIALRMLELAIAQARADGCMRVRLAAQTAATALYERAGFAVESDEFEEAGIPHVWMGLRL